MVEQRAQRAISRDQGPTRARDRNHRWSSSERQRADSRDQGPTRARDRNHRWSSSERQRADSRDPITWCRTSKQELRIPHHASGFSPEPVSAPCLNSVMSTTTHTPLEELDSPSQVLGFARSCKVDADRAQANLLVAAATWAEQHPPESIGLEATWIAGGGDTSLPLAGPGAPLVAEFCIAEFAAALQMSRRRTSPDRISSRAEIPPAQALGPRSLGRPAGLEGQADRGSHLRALDGGRHPRR